MELNRTMILLSGCFLIVWSTFKWKIPHVIWDVKLTRVCSVILGLYNIILAICFEKDLSIFLFIVDLILYMLLDIGFLMVKLKKDKNKTLKSLDAMQDYANTMKVIKDTLNDSDSEQDNESVTPKLVDTSTDNKGESLPINNTEHY